MDERERTIRAICSVAHLDDLAEDIVASGMPIPDVRRLLLTVLAMRDEALDCAPSMPNMDSLSGGWVPAPVLERVRTIVAIAVGDSRMPPRGLQ